MRSLRTYRLILGCVLATVSVLGIVTDAFAAEVSSANSAEDTYRCQWGAYQSGSPARMFTRAYCYFLPTGTNSATMTTFLRANAGSDVNVTAGGTNQYNAIDVMWRATDGLSWSGRLTGVWEVGPQTSSTGVTLPAGAALWRTTASTVTVNGAYAGYARKDNSSTTTMTGNFFANSNYGGGRRSIFAGGGTTEAAIDAEKWDNIDHFPGGSSASISQFCGAAVTVTPAAPTIVTGGDEITLSITKVAGLTGDIDIEWTTDDWVNVLNAAAIGTTHSVTLTVPDELGWFDFRTLSSIRIRCYDLSVGVYRYLNLGDADGSTRAGARACAVAKLYRPGDTSQYFNGVSYDFRVVYTGQATGTVTVGYSIYDPSYTSPQSSPSWPLVYTTPTAWTNMALGSSVTVPITALYNGSPRQVQFKCTDAEGVYLLGTWKTPLIYSNSVPAGQEDCFDQDWGVNPVAWVPSAGRMGICITKLLYIPSDDYLEERFGSESAEGVYDDTSIFYPLTLMGDTVNGLADMAVVTDAQVSAGGCTLSIPFGSASTDGKSITSSSVMGMTGLSTNTCATGIRNITKMIRYLTLVTAVLGFIFWLYRWASRLSMGNGEK
jgi:hypothetical protein